MRCGWLTNALVFPVRGRKDYHLGPDRGQGRATGSIARRSPYESRPISPPQEHCIRVLELISTIWDMELHVAGLRLLNNLPLPDYVHPQLRRVMPSLMEIVQSDYILAQVPARQGRPGAAGGKSRGEWHIESRAEVQATPAEAQTHPPFPSVPYSGTSCPPPELPGSEERPSL